MRWLLNMMFVILLLITAAFTARYIKAETFPPSKQVSWQAATPDIRNR